MNEFTHFDRQGRARMVDVTLKPATARIARATAQVSMRAETLQRIRQGKLTKGDVLQVARLAGIMASKRTDLLIPLCHGISLESAEIDFSFPDETTLLIESTVQAEARTGVEMEALTAVSIAALTVYDMCKAIDREMIIRHVQLEEKLGGRSGHFLRDHGEPLPKR